MARASSGSRSSIRSIDPLMSAKSIVTVLRSPSRFSPVGSSPMRIRASLDFVIESASAAPRLAPHESQNFASGRFSTPHAGHLAARRAPHLSQNFALSRLSVPHFAQRILGSQFLQQSLGILQVGSVEALGEPV